MRRPTGLGFSRYDFMFNERMPNNCAPRAADADWYHLRFQEVLEKGGRAIELASCVDDTPAEVRARCHDICISRMLPTAS